MHTTRCEVCGSVLPDIWASRQCFKVRADLTVEWKGLIITTAHHMSLSWARFLQSIHPHPTSWSSISIFFPSIYIWVFQVVSLSPLGFPAKILYAPLHSPMCATCPAHLILLDMITWIILGKDRSLSTSLFSFLHSPFTLSHLDPHILLDTLFLNTLSLCSSLDVDKQVSRPYKTKGKITVLYILIFIWIEASWCAHKRNMILKYVRQHNYFIIQGDSNMTRTDIICLHTNQSRSYLNYLV